MAGRQVCKQASSLVSTHACLLTRQLSYLCPMARTRKNTRNASQADAGSEQDKNVRKSSVKPTSKKQARREPAKETRKDPVKEPSVRDVKKEPVKELKPEPPKEPRKELPPPAPAEEKLPVVILDQSVAILIDGNNIEMSLHSVSGKKGAMINFDKLVPALLMNRALSRLIYFREGKSISQKLAERLQKMFHGSVVPCYKSADIPLTIKAVQVASKVDTIIILSGDADYVELVRHLKHDGIRVEIAAFPETTADVLRSESDYFFPITVDYSFVLK